MTTEAQAVVDHVEQSLVKWFEGVWKAPGMYGGLETVEFMALHNLALLACIRGRVFHSRQWFSHLLSQGYDTKVWYFHTYLEHKIPNESERFPILMRELKSLHDAVLA